MQPPSESWLQLACLTDSPLLSAPCMSGLRAHSRCCCSLANLAETHCRPAAVLWWLLTMHMPPVAPAQLEPHKF